MKNLYIDIETTSPLSLNAVGVYRYSEDEDFRISLISYAVNDSSVKIVDVLHGEYLHTDVAAMLSDANVTKYAYDARFIRVCLSRYLGLPLDCFLSPDQWRCLKAQALYHGFPDDKSHIEELLGINGSICAEARAYIRKFCQSNPDEDDCGFMTHTSENSIAWRFLRESLCADTYVTRQLAETLKQYPLHECDWEAYFANERINDRGVLVDRPLVDHAICCSTLFRKRYLNQLQQITGLKHADSASEYRAWLESQGVSTESLSRSALRRLHLTAKSPVSQSLELWQKLSRASTQKYLHARSALCGDNRLRGLFTFAGGRFGKFGSEIIQVGNLPVSKLSALHEMRKHVRLGDFNYLDGQCSSVTEALSELLATVFIPQKGHQLIVMEFPELEERVLRWLAMQEGGTCCDPQDETKCEQHVCNSEPLIHRLWRDLEYAAGLCLMQSTSLQSHGIGFCYGSDMSLYITLPSGRHIACRDAICTPDVNKQLFISYEGYGDKRHWQLNIINGSKLTRTIVQGIAYDILLEAMRSLQFSEHAVVLHSSGLLVLESPDDADMDFILNLNTIMSDWINDIPILLHCYSCDDYYEKSTDTTRRI